MVLTLLGGGSCANEKTDAQVATEALAAGLRAHGEGRLAEAETAYRQVLIHAPRNNHAYYNTITPEPAPPENATLSP